MGWVTCRDLAMETEGWPSVVRAKGSKERPEAKPICT